ncbi:hypothetical protein HOY80DRAFT_1105429 [Tuber brumale]|nr:hypothetical protein HOY80DRAFT_1105429 [Tuber brumale]
MNKAVYVATPAPSPPPSPRGVGGKGLKKRNYQTNNNFAFLYPHISFSAVNNKLTGKRWWKEAGDLVSGSATSTPVVAHFWGGRKAFLGLRRGLDVDGYILNERKEIEGGRRSGWSQ